MVRERLSGQMDRFRVAPVTSMELLVGKYVAYARAQPRGERHRRRAAGRRAGRAAARQHRPLRRDRAAAHLRVARLRAADLARRRFGAPGGAALDARAAGQRLLLRLRPAGHRLRAVDAVRRLCPAGDPRHRDAAAADAARRGARHVDAGGRCSGSGSCSTSSRCCGCGASCARPTEARASRPALAGGQDRSRPARSAARRRPAPAARRAAGARRSRTGGRRPPCRSHSLQRRRARLLRLVELGADARDVRRACRRARRPRGRAYRRGPTPGPRWRRTRRPAAASGCAPKTESSIALGERRPASPMRRAPARPPPRRTPATRRGWHRRS